VVVNGKSGDITRSVTLKASVKSKTSLGFDIQFFPDEQTTIPGFATTFVARINPINYFDGPVELSVEAGQGSLDIDIVNPGQVDHPALITVTPPTADLPNLPYWTHHILIKGVGTLNESPGFSYENYMVVSLTVDARDLPDFIMSVTPTHTRGITTSTVHFDLQITSPNYFSQDVVLSVDGVPKGSTGSFSATIVTLPAKVRYSLELGSVWGAGTPVLTFKATGGSVTHYAPASIYHLLTGFTNDFNIQVLPPIQVVSPGGTIQYLINGTGNKTIDEFEVDVGDSPFTALITPGYDGNPDYRLMTVKVDQKAVPGKYTCKVYARSEWEHNDTFTVVVDEANDFTLSLAEENINWYPDYPASFDISGFYSLGITNGEQIDIQVLGFSGTKRSMIFSLGDVTVLVQIRMTTYRPNGTYMLAFVGDVPGKPYPKVLIGTVTIAGPMPVLGLTNLEVSGSQREGGTMIITTTVNNWGKVDAHDVTVEFFVDGKLIGRKVVETLAVDSEEAPVEVEWKAVEGTHNITVVLIHEEGKVIDEKATLKTEVTVHPVNLTGPAIAVLLLLMIGGLAFGLASSARKDRSARPRTKTRIDEEE